jgi:hypothetical protein
MGNLTEKAMIVVYKHGEWGGKVKDKEISADIKKRMGASDDAGNFWKRLMPNKVKEINTLYQQFYLFHRKMTVPWEEGRALIMNKVYFDYVKQARESKKNIFTKVNEMLSIYQNEVEVNEVKRLGTMYKREDYPSLNEIKGRYYFDLHFEPIPESDFRIAISDTEREELKKQYEQVFEEKLNEGLKTVWFRIYELCKKMEETLHDPDKSFHKTLITNIEDLCELLPSLNFSENVELEKMREELLLKLCSHRPDVLRDDLIVREKVADEAEEILKKISAYL